jgi:CGNR zinc finger
MLRARLATISPISSWVTPGFAGGLDVVAAVNRVVTYRPHAQLVVRDGRLRRDRPTPISPARVAVAELAHDSIDMLTGPTATELRACHAPGCVRYFVKSHPRREWCSEACGNPARAARHYRRIRGKKTTIDKRGAAAPRRRGRLPRRCGVGGCCGG